MKALAALGALLCALCSMEGGAAYTFQAFMGAALTPSAVSSTAVVKRACECRALCSDFCVAVAITRHPPGRFHCSFTEKITDDVNSCLVPAPDTRVYRKRLGCQTSFTLVDDVGCVYISTQALNFSAAAAACPPNSKLFAANFLIDFDALRNFLMKKLAPSVKTIWIGLTRTSNITTWAWAGGGGTIEATHPSPYWAPYDPNDNTADCAGLYLSSSSRYHLADEKCASQHVFICKQD